MAKTKEVKNVVTKTDIITDVATITEMKKCDVEKVLNAFFNYIPMTLSENKENEKFKIQIMGFGSFKTSFIPGRTGLNPIEKKKGNDVEITIPDSYRTLFSAGQNMKDIVNDKVEVEKPKKEEKKVSKAKKSSKKK